MNERIAKLAEQAGLLGPSSRIGNSHDAAERFAQLIVRECVGICLERHDSWKFDDESNSNSGPRDCAQMIEEHFGVEE